MIRFDDVHKSFGEQLVLRGVSFEVARGSVHYVIGESGAGKSVLIKHVVGLLLPDGGRVFYGDTDVTQLDEPGFRAVRQRCQMIFQHATLFDALSVLENVAMPLRKRFALDRRTADERARAALAKVQVDGFAQRLPVALGAGVRKRIAIARALALKPETLLYDEPTTSLDPVAARRTDALIRRTTTELGLTSLVVSHDLTSVRTGDRVTFLKEGRVHFDGTPSELMANHDLEVRRFVHGERPRWQA